MGIEPTGRARNARPDDFEDRGHHQVCKHFRSRSDYILAELDRPRQTGTKARKTR